MSFTERWLTTWRRSSGGSLWRGKGALGVEGKKVFESLPLDPFLRLRLGIVEFSQLEDWVERWVGLMLSDVNRMGPMSFLVRP